MEGTVANEKKLVGTLSGGGVMTGGVGTVFGKDGKDGKDGFSPEIYVTQTAYGYKIEIETLNHCQSLDIKNGVDGAKGEPGNPGVYVGSGDMPEDCNVQIDPNGDTFGIEDIKRLLGIPTPKIAYIQLPASAWEGADSLYSQVVTIDGTTEHSKVDLLPSVEQLAIFHGKDVAFVTENDNGVVTVYAIGDKPLLDYTMQVQITEVTV